MKRDFMFTAVDKPWKTVGYYIIVPWFSHEKKLLPVLFEMGKMIGDVRRRGNNKKKAQRC
jgi:hypothetical protein